MHICIEYESKTDNRQYVSCRAGQVHSVSNRAIEASNNRDVAAYAAKRRPKRRPGRGILYYSSIPTESPLLDETPRGIRLQCFVCMPNSIAMNILTASICVLKAHEKQNLQSRELYSKFQAVPARWATITSQASHTQIYS